MNLPATRPPWHARAYGQLRLWTRAALGSLSALRSPPLQAGVSSGVVARANEAQEHLRALSTSPVVLAAVNRRALGLATYPIRVYSETQANADPIGRDEAQWVASLLRLLELPDPEDWAKDALFPVSPGEAFSAQLSADLILTGDAFVAPTVGSGSRIVGLTRLHPQTVTLERRQGVEYWVHRQSWHEDRWYPRRTVAHLHLLSWQADGRSVLGVGAGHALRELVAAEEVALRQTRQVVSQGGADVMITGKSPAMAQFLGVAKNREQVAKDASSALAGEDGRRVFVVGGDLSVSDAGLRPADLRAPELLEASRAAELAAVGATPVSIGGESATYATAVQQYRVQAELDEQLASVIEAGLLRPLARHFARLAGDPRADRVTCRLDLSTHPGYAYLRTDAYNRMQTLVQLGWTAAQAADAEDLDLPEPEGEPMSMPGQAPTGGGQGPGEPRRPAGDGERVARTRSLGDLVRAQRAASARAERETWWRAREARRASWDERLAETAYRQLQKDAEAVAARAEAALGEAALGEAARATGEPHTRADEDGAGQSYGPVDIEAILGDADADTDAWVDSLGWDWLDSYDDAAEQYLSGVEGTEQVPPTRATPADLDTWRLSARQVVEWQRQVVRDTVEEGIRDGRSVSKIAEDLRGSHAFGRMRALRIARTEVVRSQSSGELARWEAAEGAGVHLDSEWVSAGFWDPATRDTHAAMDGQVRAPGQPFTIPATDRHPEMGTPGPGLSGEVSEDVNCRCGLKPVPREE